MSYSFNAAPVAAGDNLQDPNIWNQHLAAVQERFTAVDTNARVGNGSLAVVTTGTDVQRSQWWSYMDVVGGPVPTPQYFGMQAAIMKMIDANFYIDHRTVLEGYSPVLTSLDPIRWTFPALRAAAGLPAMYQINSGVMPGWSDLSSLPANSSWQRKRLREVFKQTGQTSATDTRDSQGNPAVAGQHGWHADGLAMQLWTCISSGNWHRDPVTPAGPVVNMLDNATDFPTAITIDHRGAEIFHAYALAAYEGYSSMVNAGDYIGHWLFGEVRATVNLLRWAVIRPLSNISSYVGHGISNVSYADALAQMAASWAPGSPGIPGGSKGSGAYVSAAYDAGPTWYVYAQRWSDTYEVGTYSALPAVPKQIDVYMFTTAAVDGSYYSSPPTDTWDAQGDPVLQGQYHKVRTSATTSATSVILPPKIGDETTIPPNVPPDPATYGNARLGYETTDAIAVIRFDVAGGFVYKF